MELPSGLVLTHTAPLFKEERYLGSLALLYDRFDPCLLHWTCPNATLSPDNNPMNAMEVQRTYVFKQWLKGQEPYLSWCRLQMGDAGGPIVSVFNADPPPDVRSTGCISPRL